MSTQTCYCVHCGEIIQFPDNLAGTNGFCPSCGQPVLLQSAVTTAAPQISSEPVPSTTPSQSKKAEKSSDYLDRIRKNTCYESARIAVGFSSFLLYLASGGIVVAGCYYGENNGGGPAVSVIGWVIIGLTKGGKHLILAILDMADIQIDANRRK